MTGQKPIVMLLEVKGNTQLYELSKVLQDAKDNGRLDFPFDVQTVTGPGEYTLTITDKDV